MAKKIKVEEKEIPKVVILRNDRSQLNRFYDALFDESEVEVRYSLSPRNGAFAEICNIISKSDKLEAAAMGIEVYSFEKTFHYDDKKSEVRTVTNRDLVIRVKRKNGKTVVDANI